MKTLLVVLAVMLTGCGYSSMQNETIGQVKKVVKNTPLICPDYVDADVSLGVMRNGVGSMSTEDLWFYVPDEQARQTLAQAAQTGALVKITYDVKRVTFCVSDHFVSKVELVK